jgi:hypothetical protein
MSEAMTITSTLLTQRIDTQTAKEGWCIEAGNEVVFSSAMIGRGVRVGRVEISS